MSVRILEKTLAMQHAMRHGKTEEERGEALRWLMLRVPKERNPKIRKNIQRHLQATIGLTVTVATKALEKVFEAQHAVHHAPTQAERDEAAYYLLYSYVSSTSRRVREHLASTTFAQFPAKA